jgi:ATP-dependent DNA ligase
MTCEPHPALMRRPADQPALCQLVKDWAGNMPATGAICEPKLDGIRALWIDGELVTREGAAIHGAEHIVEVLHAIEHEAAVPMFLEGEWIVHGSFTETLRHFRSAGGRGDAGCLHIFEGMTMRAWRGEDPSEALQARRAKLDALVKPFECDAVRLVPWAYLTSSVEIERAAADFIAQGGEGVVVKDPLATYRRKLDGSWRRIKKRLTLDLEVVGYEPDARRPFLLGVLIVDYEGKRVRVAAGFSDSQRLAMWRERDGLIGSIHEVEAMETTEKGSLRHPRWVRARPDKSRSAAWN